MTFLSFSARVVSSELVKPVPDFAFNGCYAMSTVAIPDSVTSIGMAAFQGCGLTSLSLPDSVTSIGAYAFYACWPLPLVAIPSSVTSIGDQAFESHTRLVFDISNASISGIDQAYAYTGSSIAPVPEVSVCGRTLSPETDYALSYFDNVAVGTARVVVTGTNGNTGTAIKQFAVGKASLSTATVSGISPHYVFTGAEIAPIPTVQVGEKPYHPVSTTRFLLG